MAYGTPASGDQVADYFTHIRGGRTPPPEAIEHLRHRYERVGGGTPLLKITEEVRSRLERALDERGDPRRVYLGMRHWHPFIAEAAVVPSPDPMRLSVPKAYLALRAGAEPPVWNISSTASHAMRPECCNAKKKPDSRSAGFH